MRITTIIDVSGDTYPYTEEQAAAQVLAALGGNAANDVSVATIHFHNLRINTSIQLEDGDNMAYTADQAAAQVLAALAGNPTTDFAQVSYLMGALAGATGVPPGNLPPEASAGQAQSRE